MTRTRISSKATSPEAVLAHIEPGADIVMPNANHQVLARDRCGFPAEQARVLLAGHAQTRT
jgi:hypothetical protein